MEECESWNRGESVDSGIAVGLYGMLEIVNMAIDTVSNKIGVHKLCLIRRRQLRYVEGTSRPGNPESKQQQQDIAARGTTHDVGFVS